jgi:hypothetical protein
VIVRKFRAGVQDHHEQVQTVNLVPGATATTSLIEVPAYGFLRGLWVKVTVTGGVGSGTPATYREDAPFTWFNQIQIQDVNSAPIIFSISGHDLYLIYKYGGYYFQADPKSSEEYSQGGIGGNSVFILYIPLELRNRDALGSLTNTSANTAYKVSLSGGVLADVFSVNPAPTTPTNMRVDVWQDSWWEPKEVDLAGRPQAQTPPSKDTTQYWSKTVFTYAGAGAITSQIKRLGYLYRNIILVCRTTTIRANTQIPDPLTIVYEGQQLTIRDRQIWRHQMSRWFGYNGTAEAAGALDNGVVILPFNRDFGLQPGAEIGNGYLPTASGTRLELQGNLAAAGSITGLLNDVSALDELDITG